MSQLITLVSKNKQRNEKQNICEIGGAKTPGG